MAFQASTSNRKLSGANITVTVPTYSLNSELLVCVSVDDPSAWTPPSDFTLVGAAWSTGGDQNAAVYRYTGNAGAGCPASGLSSYNFLHPSGGEKAFIATTWTGRANATPAHTAWVDDATSSVMPYSLALTASLTLVGGEDLIFFWASDGALATGTYTAALTGYTQTEPDTGTSIWCHMGLLTQANASAGATGTPTVGFSGSTSTGTKQFGGKLLALAAAGAGPTGVSRRNRKHFHHMMVR